MRSDPGRQGSGAPQGEVRLLRAIALATRGEQNAGGQPLHAKATSEVAAHWAALYALPRAQRIAWTIGNLSKARVADDEAAFIMGVTPDVFAAERDAAHAALGEHAGPAERAGLAEALSPVPTDGVAEALQDARRSAQRRWKGTGALLVLAFLIMAALLGSIMLDLVGRDTKDEQERERLDRAQREFSNPMPADAGSKDAP